MTNVTQQEDPMNVWPTVEPNVPEETRWPICPECLTSLDTPSKLQECAFCGTRFGHGGQDADT